MMKVYTLAIPFAGCGMLVAAALFATPAPAQQPQPAECAVKAEEAAEKDAPPLPAEASDRDRIWSTQTASRYFTRPGASVEDYVAARGRCDRIVRGCQSPTGHKPKPNVDFGSTPFIAMENSSMGMGLLGGLIAAIVGAPTEIHRLRLGRRACMLLDGWQMVEPDEAEQARIRALDPEAQAAFFAKAVGESAPNGRITVWTNAMAQPGPAGSR